jgi:hypothetical protein
MPSESASYCAHNSLVTSSSLASHRLLVQRTASLDRSLLLLDAASSVFIPGFRQLLCVAQVLKFDAPPANRGPFRTARTYAPPICSFHWPSVPVPLRGLHVNQSRFFRRATIQAHRISTPSFGASNVDKLQLVCRICMHSCRPAPQPNSTSAARQTVTTIKGFSHPICAHIRRRCRRSP